MAKKNIILYSIITLFIFTILFGVVVVSSTELSNLAPADNWLGRIDSWIKYNFFKKSTTFSIYGASLDCGPNPLPANLMKKDQTAYWSNSQDYGANSVFINYFRGSPTDGIYPEHTGDSRQYLGEIYLEGQSAWITEGSGAGNIILNPQFTCDAGMYWNNDCYWEVYKCAKTTCASNSQCGSGFCDFSTAISSIIGRGVCATLGGSITIDRIDIPAREDRTRVLNIVWSGGTSPYTLEIEWGDGGGFYKEGITSKTYSVSHTYASSGTYNGAVTINDATSGDSKSFSVIISPPAIPCGNGVIDTGEQCDGTNLNGKNCTTQGFTGGTLSCSSSCNFITSACTGTTACNNNGVCDSGETTTNCPNDCTVSNSDCSLNFGAIACLKNLDCEYSAPNCIPRVNSFKYKEFIKLPLTKDEKSTATNDMLFTSSCLDSIECGQKSGYNVSCVKIASLRNDGTLADFDGNSFFNRADNIISTGLNGAATGAGVGIIGCAVAVGIAAGVSWLPLSYLVTVPEAIVICSAAIPGFTYVGALIGAAVGNTLDSSDELVIKLQARDENSVGICTAVTESSWCKYTSWAAFFKITGNKCNDGLIIIFGGLVLVMLLFKK